MSIPAVSLGLITLMPRVIVYNSVSVDGAIKDFEINVELHYKVAGKIGADAMLVGSNTAKSGIEMFTDAFPSEEPADFFKPAIDEVDDRPFWIIPDSRGVLNGLLHVLRRSGYSKDVILLVSSKTPSGYLEYLKARNFDFIIAGDNYVDYTVALEEINRRYGVKTLVTDSGGILAGILIERGLVDEIQLLVSPQIVGKTASNLFRNINQNVKLQLLNSRSVNNSHVLLIYKVIR